MNPAIHSTSAGIKIKNANGEFVDSGQKQYSVCIYDFDYDKLIQFKDGLVFEGQWELAYGCPGWTLTTDILEVAEYVADVFDTR